MGECRGAPLASNMGKIAYCLLLTQKTVEAVKIQKWKPIRKQAIDGTEGGPDSGGRFFLPLQPTPEIAAEDIFPLGEFTSRTRSGRRPSRGRRGCRPPLRIENLKIGFSLKIATFHRPSSKDQKYLAEHKKVCDCYSQHAPIIAKNVLCFEKFDSSRTSKIGCF